MFKKYQKPESAATVRPATQQPAAQGVPGAEVQSLVPATAAASTAVAEKPKELSKDEQRRRRLMDLRLQMHRRLLENLNLAAIETASDQDVDAVFLSCTNLRTLDVIPAVEAVLNLPVFSSNQVLAWHMSELAGLASEA